MNHYFRTDYPDSDKVVGDCDCPICRGLYRKTTSFERVLGWFIVGMLLFLIVLTIWIEYDLWVEIVEVYL